ncbi:Anaphase-promoting complex subunit 5 [Polyrhizophydium stewartii]|uniref:Anaphase-promoting complex subunit 5 n=1 Tax=Polyrhizophydium stewartii TaxID=2732419 RepID=A0ABR4NBC8_9FUNG
MLRQTHTLTPTSVFLLYLIRKALPRERPNQKAPKIELADNSMVGLLVFIADKLAGDPGEDASLSREPETLASFASKLRNIRFFRKEIKEATNETTNEATKRKYEEDSEEDSEEEAEEDNEGKTFEEIALQFAEVIKSIYSLDVFMKRVRSDIKKTKTNNDSPLLVFMRECALAYKLMDFDQIAHLFDDIKAFSGALMHGSLDMSFTLAEQFVDKQIHLIEESSKVAAPAWLREQLRRITESMPSLSKAHYLAYLVHLHAGEIDSAVTTLCRFVDSVFELADGTMSYNQRHHYAIVNLAALYARAGYPQLALSALNQAFPIAHEAGDEMCMSYLLSWLHRLCVELGRDTIMESAQGTIPSEKHMLDALTEDTKSRGQHQLLVLAYLSKARWGLIQGKTPVYVLHALQIASSLAEHYGLEGLAAKTEIARAGIYDAYGNTRLAAATLQQVLLENHKHVAADDLAVALSKLATMEASHGHNEAVKRLSEMADRQFPASGAFHASKLWMFAYGKVLFEREWLRLKPAEAERALANLISNSRWVGESERVIKECEARLAAMNGRPHEAYRLLLRLTEPQADSTAEPSLDYIWSMLDMADLLLESGREGAISALPVTLRCASLADQYHLGLARSQGLVRLAQILLHLEYAQQARRLVDEVMPAILAHGNALERGRVLVVHAQVLIATALPLSPGNDLEAAVRELHRAEMEFEKIGARRQLEQCLELCILASNAAGRTEERDAACGRLRALVQ